MKIAESKTIMCEEEKVRLQVWSICRNFSCALLPRFVQSYEIMSKVDVLFIFQTLLKLTQKRRHHLSFGADDEELLSDDDDSSEDATTVADSSEDATTVADSSEDATTVADAMGRNKYIKTINQTLKNNLSFPYFKNSHQLDSLILLYCTWIICIPQPIRKAQIQILNPGFFLTYLAFVLKCW